MQQLPHQMALMLEATSCTVPLQTQAEIADKLKELDSGSPVAAVTHSTSSMSPTAQSEIAALRADIWPSPNGSISRTPVVTPPPATIVAGVVHTAIHQTEMCVSSCPLWKKACKFRETAPPGDWWPLAFLAQPPVVTACLSVTESGIFVFLLILVLADVFKPTLIPKCIFTIRDCVITPQTCWWALSLHQLQLTTLQLPPRQSPTRTVCSRNSQRWQSRPITDLYYTMPSTASDARCHRDTRTTGPLAAWHRIASQWPTTSFSTCWTSAPSPCPATIAPLPFTWCPNPTVTGIYLGTSGLWTTAPSQIGIPYRISRISPVP